MEIKTYPEMNETIKDLLRRSEDPMNLYILARIEDLEKRVEALTPPPNDPLTLEELREMDGEPVWCAFPDDCGRYMIIQWNNSEFFKSYECGFLLAEEYGKSWLAYRRKPEEGTI